MSAAPKEGSVRRRGNRVIIVKLPCPVQPERKRRKVGSRKGMCSNRGNAINAGWKKRTQWREEVTTLKERNDGEGGRGERTSNCSWG